MRSTDPRQRPGRAAGGVLPVAVRFPDLWQGLAQPNRSASERRARDDRGRNAASRLAPRLTRLCNDRFDCSAQAPAVLQDVMKLTEFDAMLIAPRAPAPAQGWLT